MFNKINLKIILKKEKHFKNQAYKNIFFRDVFIRLIKHYCQLIDLLLSIFGK